jgi:NTE family protein
LTNPLTTTAERKAEPRIKRRPVALVLGGGGLKGFAHIGVLRALAELDIKPSVYAGTSIGSLISAAAVSGMPIEEMEEHARGLRRRDLFRLNRLGIVLERTHAPSIYQGGPLREVCASVVKDMKFDELSTTLLVNTVDLQRGSPVVWGLPGLRDVSVLDASMRRARCRDFIRRAKSAAAPAWMAAWWTISPRELHRTEWML